MSCNYVNKSVVVIVFMDLPSLPIQIPFNLLKISYVRVSELTFVFSVNLFYFEETGHKI